MIQLASPPPKPTQLDNIESLTETFIAAIFIPPDWCDVLYQSVDFTGPTTEFFTEIEQSFHRFLWMPPVFFFYHFLFPSAFSTYFNSQTSGHLLILGLFFILLLSLLYKTLS